VINSSRTMNTFRRLTLVPLIAFGFLSIVATGGGGGSDPPPPPPPPDGVITTTNAARLIGNVIGADDPSPSWPRVGVAVATLPLPHRHQMALSQRLTPLG
jgi:hypothetical protein